MREETKIIKLLAKKQIDKCKFSCYGIKDAGNESEGDYGDWKHWEDVLIKFGKKVYKLIK